MRAVVYSAPRQFEIREVPVPEPTPGAVRVKVIQTGVCGTDLHLHDGQFMARFPLTPGHEIVGTVDALGDGVSGPAVGEQVVINPNSACGHCGFCVEGRPLLCEHFAGIGSTHPGGFAEYVVAAAADVFSAEGLHPDTAVVTEPASCAAHGVEVLGPRVGSRALVIGAGPTGLLLAQLLAAGGAAHVTVAAPTAFKLDTALALGADEVYRMDRGDLPGDVAALLERTGGQGYDLVVEATGAPAVVEACVPLTRSGGTIGIYGVADESATAGVSPYEIFRRELTIKGSFAEIHSFPAALAALRSGRVRTDGLITHRFGIDSYGDALEALRSDPTAHKIVVTA